MPVGRLIRQGSTRKMSVQTLETPHHHLHAPKASFLTEVDTSPYGNVIKPRRREEQNVANIYDRRFEDEETQRTRTFLYLWYDVTQDLKLTRRDKTEQMMMFTRSANAKMKVEVRGVMSSVIFGSWKNFALRKKWRREELKRIREEEELAEKVEKEKNDKKERMERMSLRKNRMSWKHGSSRGSTPTGFPNPADSSLPTSPPPETHSPAPPFVKPTKKEPPNLHLTNPTHLSPRPRKPPGSPPKRADVNFTRRQTYGYHASCGRTESNVPGYSTMPLPENVSNMVKRLSNPPNYIPQFMRRDKADDDHNALFSSLLPDRGNDMFDTGSDHGSFEDALVDMYKKHKKKVGMGKKGKKGKKKKPNLIGHGSPPPSKKPHPPISSKERTRKATVVASQKDAMNRLFLGLGANPTTNNPSPETNENHKFVRRGSQYKGRKKSVVVQQLLKEKESMLGFLDKLVKPVDVGINQNLH
ncbi:hypothetical protein TrLO_g2992 [Triparma laevis f. longispina]|uniref:Uncharacterized protein n=1 Tax=Triparma laevis f. longispina TaxID=1714387 RepID=A0A9W7A319_9STRA|nr:hypothetical protein TrLO_g2992 [Triparma laevis f. longispina]